MRLVRLDADQDHLAVMHAVFGAQRVHEPLHLARRALQDHGVEAMVVPPNASIQVCDVLGFLLSTGPWTN